MLPIGLIFYLIWSFGLIIISNIQLECDPYATIKILCLFLAVMGSFIFWGFMLKFQDVEFMEKDFKRLQTKFEALEQQSREDRRKIEKMEWERK